MRRTLGALIGGSALVIGSVAGVFGVTAVDDETTRDASMTITEAGGLGVLRLRVGDCLDLVDLDAEYLESVEGLPCDEPHSGQVFAEFDVAEESFPGQEELATEAAIGCEDRLRGTVEDASEFGGAYDVFSLSPTAATWEVGDREVTCILVRHDGGELGGELR